MKLGQKIIKDKIVFEQLDTNYIATSVLDEEIYTDISSIENWYNAPVLDWSRRRDEIKPLFFAKAGAQLQNYGTLSDLEKEIGARVFFIPYALRVPSIFSDSQDKDNFKFLLKETRLSRETCIEAMRVHIGEKMRNGILSLEQSQTFFKDVNSMIQTFIGSNHPEFKLWLTSTTGVVLNQNIDFSTTGFASKSGYFSQSFLDELLDIYNGNY